MHLLKCYLKYWFWLFLAFVLLFLIMILPKLGNEWRNIEADVAQRVTNDLQASGYDWVSVSTEDQGRKVILSGSAISKEQKEDALKLARSVVDERGNKAVTEAVWVDKPMPAPSQAPTVQISKVGNDIVLAGELGSQNDIDALVQATRTQYPDATIDNRLTIKPDVKALTGLNAIVSALAFDQSQISISENNVTLEGVAQSSELRADFADKIASALGSGYSINNLITIAAPAIDVIPEEVQEQINVCQNRVNSLMQDNKIAFATGSSNISNRSFPLLDELTAAIKACPEFMIEIYGHTDSTGSQALNKTLSENRASAVMNYLTNKGIDSASLSAAGLGSSQPRASNENAAGRAQNRRIEFVIKTK